MYKSLLLSAMIFAGIALAGCGELDGPNSDDTPLSSVLPPQIGLARAYGAPGATTGTIQWSDVTNDEAFFGQFELLGDLGDLAEPTAIPTREDLEALRAFFVAHADHPSTHIAEQSVAFAILNRVLDVPSDAESFLVAEPVSQSDEARAATAYATHLLIENENPNADLIAASLRVIGDTWDEAEIARAERVAAAAAQSWANAPCVGCVDGVEPLEREGRTGRRRAVLAAAEGLAR